MEMLIYDFQDEMYWLLFVLYGFLALVGIGVIATGIWQAIVASRTAVHTFRILFVAGALLIGIVFSYFGTKNLFALGQFYQDWYQEDYFEVSGPLEDVSTVSGQYRDESLLDVTFTVNGHTFNCVLTSEPIAHFEKGQMMTVQYGYVGDELLLYRIYTEN